MVVAQPTPATSSGQDAGSSTASIVNMMFPEIFANEDGHSRECEAQRHKTSSKTGFMRFTLFRLYNLDQEVTVHCATVEGVGSARPYKHYTPSSKDVHFPTGCTIAHMEVEIINDNNWEPIRDFSVQLTHVVSGHAILGLQRQSTCIIVDDDTYPSKIPRRNRPRDLAEANHPSCVGSADFLTPDEMGDVALIKGYILDRVTSTWPQSAWGFVWVLYRGAYHVFISYVTKVFVDKVWLGHTDDADSFIYAAVCSVAVLVLTVFQSHTESWLTEDMKQGHTVKALRDAMAVQLLWSDDGRMSLMRTADYLNACINEVQAAAEIYELVFPALERVADFVLSTVIVIILFPVAAPVIFVLLPITVLVQRYRAPYMRVLLEQKQLYERRCTSIIADIIENAHSFRSLPGAGFRVRQELNETTEIFASLTLEAAQYNVTTKERIEMVQGLVLSIVLMSSSWIVNNQWDFGGLISPATAGTALVVVTAFISSSEDLIHLSTILLRMKFHAEGLRNVARVLNLQTDAHRLVLAQTELAHACI